MAFLKLSTSRKCSQLLLQESLRNDVYARFVRSLTTANGSAEQQQRRNNSVAATAVAGTVDSKPKWDPLDTSFADPEATFKSKTTWEIFRAYIVYQLCSSSYLVENNMQVNVWMLLYDTILRLFIGTAVKRIKYVFYVVCSLFVVIRLVLNH